MFDWLGLTPAQTQIVGWVMIVIGAVVLAVLIWLLLTKGKAWMGFQRNVKKINQAEKELEKLENNSDVKADEPVEEQENKQSEDKKEVSKQKKSTAKKTTKSEKPSEKTPSKEAKPKKQKGTKPTEKNSNKS